MSVAHRPEGKGKKTWSEYGFYHGTGLPGQSPEFIFHKDMTPISEVFEKLGKPLILKQELRDSDRRSPEEHRRRKGDTPKQAADLSTERVKTETILIALQEVLTAMLNFGVVNWQTPSVKLLKRDTTIDIPRGGVANFYGIVGMTLGLRPQEVEEMKISEVNLSLKNVIKDRVAADPRIRDSITYKENLSLTEELGVMASKGIQNPQAEQSAEYEVAPGVKRMEHYEDEKGGHYHLRMNAADINYNVSITSETVDSIGIKVDLNVGDNFEYIDFHSDGYNMKDDAKVVQTINEFVKQFV
ncbi:MAG: hypothetical protein ACYCO0_04840 [Candidatus Micrarchaeaceae archaeon]